MPLPDPWLTTTVLVWGFNFVALKLLYLQMTPAAVSLVRYIPMYLLLVLLCRFRGESLKYGSDRWPVLWQGLISLGVYMILFLEGMKRTGAAEGAILLATAPVFVALFSVMAKHERFTLGAILGAVVAFIGTGLVVGASSAAQHGSLLGDALILGSSVTWAYGAILSKPLVARYSPIQSLTLSMPAALILILPYGLWDTLNTPWASFTSQSWWMLIHIVLGAGVIGFIGFYEGVKRIGPASAMLYQFFVPGIAALFAYWLLAQELRPLQFLGMLVVFAGVAIASRSRARAASRLAAT